METLMKKNPPAVSVIVPVHNVASYLEKTVRSIMEQDLRNIEIILVENMSTDNSYEICERMADEDQRIKVLKIGSPDVSAARNVGIDNAGADYLFFIDGDDTIDKDMFSSMYKAVTDKGADIGICNFVMEYPDRPAEYPYRETGETRYCSSSEMLAELLAEEVCSSACVMMCRKSLFDSVRFPENRYFEDHASTYLLVDKAKNGCVHIGKSYYHYWQRKGSICHALDFTKVCDFASGNVERIKFIGKYPGFSADTRKKLLAYNVWLYMGNILNAIKLAETKEDFSRLRTLKSAASVILPYRIVTGKDKNRLLRMKFCWGLFLRRYRKKLRSVPQEHQAG